VSGRPRALRDGLLPHGRVHRGVLAWGLAYTCLLVGARLALPLPLTAVVDRSTATIATPGPAVPVALLSAAFVGLALVAGMAEHHQRLAFAHFAGRSIGDARETALARVQSSADDSTDLATAVIGDSVRVKQALKGVLNHITVNGLLVAGVCAALAATDLRLGLVQLAGAVLLLVVSVAGAMQVTAVAARHRGRETDLAASVHALIGDLHTADDTAAVAALHHLDAEGSEAEIAMTRLEGLTTWAAHVVLVATAAMVLVLGLDSVNDEAMSVGALFAALAYLLGLHGPAVRLARQITRVGPLMASARHLGSVCSLRREA
jgi:ABC-type multidrug transport system fused ATPase/permease subunit